MESFIEEKTHGLMGDKRGWKQVTYAVRFSIPNSLWCSGSCTSRSIALYVSNYFPSFLTTLIPLVSITCFHSFTHVSVHLYMCSCSQHTNKGKGLSDKGCLMHTCISTFVYYWFTLCNTKFNEGTECVELLTVNLAHSTVCTVTFL